MILPIIGNYKMILPIIGNYNFTTTNTIPTKTKRGLSRKAHPSRYFFINLFMTF